MKQRKLLIFLILILIVKNITALGVGPAYTNVDFEPDLNKTFSFNIYNNDKQNISVMIKTSGELKDYIEILTEEINVSDDEKSKTAEFRITLPRNMEPGVYRTELFVQEKKPVGEMITATIGVSHLLTLTVPKHGKYLTKEYNIKSNHLLFSIKNIGLQDIIKTNARISILDGNTELFRKEVTIETLKSDDSFNQTFSLEINPGEYTLITELFYDEVNKTTKEKMFLGEKEIKIKRIKIDSLTLTLGKIGQIDLILESNWNKAIKDVYAEVEIYKKGVLIDTIKTITENINVKEIKTIPAFWDTKNLDAGEYEIIANIFYEDKTTRDKTTIILEKEKASLKEKQNLWPQITTSIVIATFLIINILTHFKRKTKKFIYPNYRIRK
ncbi:MAG: hypothetical protein ABIC91_07070 [Nanoarchaeota archaeon]